MVKNDNANFILKLKTIYIVQYCTLLRIGENYIMFLLYIIIVNVPAFLDGPLREPDNICLMKLRKYFELGNIIHGENKKCCLSSFHTLKPNSNFPL